MTNAPGRHVLVVIPAFNEALSIAAVVRAVRMILPRCNILVVDDGSQDATAAVATAAGAVVLRMPFNTGVGGAMRAGFRYAVREDYDCVVQVDADGQHDATAIPTLLAALDSADIVIGARFTAEDSSVAFQTSAPRRIAMRFLSMSISRLNGRRLTDTTSGFRASNRRAVELLADNYPAEYLGDTVETLIFAIRSGLRVTQVPVTMNQRKHGRSSASTPAAVLYLARAIFVMLLARVRRVERVGDTT